MISDFTKQTADLFRQAPGLVSLLIPTTRLKDSCLGSAVAWARDSASNRRWRKEKKRWATQTSGMSVHMATGSERTKLARLRSLACLGRMSYTQSPQPAYKHVRSQERLRQAAANTWIQGVDCLMYIMLAISVETPLHSYRSGIQ